LGWMETFGRITIWKRFDERNIPTKASPNQMNKELLEFCKKEIQTFFGKKTF